MNRKDFIKLTSSAIAGTPFILNGLATQAMSNFLDVPVSCSNVSDRVVVIVRLAGANDGLNMVIPMDQYDDYANLRPDIKLSDTGANQIITLDNTLANDRLTGLHPNLTGFKGLYDSGKLGLLNGVGYPSPNFSHFKSQNTMFAGKDGTTNGSLKSGMFGRFLGAVYPGLASYPTPDNPYPLVLQFGSTNPSLFYGHEHELGIEYNVSSFQNGFFNNLASFNLPEDSQHQDLLDFLKIIEGSMDTYFAAVITAFYTGSNSATTYPNTSLGKQLRTVARMIKGGSKTKVFQVNIGGFDTHVNQIDEGSTHLGRHANILGDVSDSITSFQNDIEALGIDDKIMTVTFSEFGRRVRQNGNFGTDHGSLSPFFVIGSSANAGVYGSHPVFTDTTSYLYEETQRRYDYRQLFATLLQDWLGADDTVMQMSELAQFSTSNQKIPLINGLANAYPNCLVSPGDCAPTIVATKILDDNGWSYYGQTGSDILLFAIEHTPTGTGANTAIFEAEVTLERKCESSYPENVHIKEHGTDGIYALGYYCNIALTVGSTNGWVNLRWFDDVAVEADLSTAANTFQTLSGASYQSNMLHLRTAAPLDLPAQLLENGTGLSIDYSPLLNRTTGSYNSANYTQYNEVTDINFSGGSKFLKVTNVDEGTVFPDPAIDLTGTIRYNPIKDKFEGYNGTSWVPFH